MQCEICGKETMEKKQIELDGSTLLVCPDCASFGKEKPLPRSEVPAAQAAPAQSQPQRYSAPHRAIGTPSFSREQFDLGLDLVPDYGKIVRHAREKREMTVQELARKIFEKDSLLHRIESMAIKPSDVLISKLEKELRVTLKNKAED